MADELREQLETQLYDKMKAENTAYLAQLQTRPVGEIIENAYQIAYRENVLCLLEDSTTLTIRQLQTLLEMPDTMAELYSSWCDRDTNEMEVLREGIEYCASDILRHKAEERFSDPAAPMFDKSFDDAHEADELYEWKANHLRNEECNRTFEHRVGLAHAEGRFSAFLQEWVKAYGLERCMFVLSCTIAQCPSDGRYYPPARKVTARFHDQRVRYHGFADRYRNSVHPGIVNLAMEGFLRIELEKGHKPQSKVRQSEKIR